MWLVVLLGGWSVSFWAQDRRKSRGACTFLSPQTLLLGDTCSPGKPFSQGREPSKSYVEPGGVGRAGLRRMVCVCCSVGSGTCPRC